MSHRRGHPVIGRTLTLKTYTRLDHVLVSFGGDLRGIVVRDRFTEAMSANPTSLAPT
jgi:hypothetical protein